MIKQMYDLKISLSEDEENIYIGQDGDTIVIHIDTIDIICKWLKLVAIGDNK